MFKVILQSLKGGECVMCVCLCVCVCESVFRVLPSGIVFMALKCTLSSVAASSTSQMPTRISKIKQPKKKKKSLADGLALWTIAPVNYGPPSLQHKHSCSSHTFRWLDHLLFIHGCTLPAEITKNSKIKTDWGKLWPYWLLTISFILLQVFILFFIIIFAPTVF